MARILPSPLCSCPSAWLVLTACLMLSGCALTSTAPSVPATIEGSAIQGSVHGGQQPVTGANVYLLAANTTGYGQPSVSLLTTGAGSDSIGYYVQTNSSGVFSITNDYTCTAGQQVYLYASGGNSGSGANSAIGLMAVLGTCPASGNFLASLPLIQVNELTTIAAAYSLSGYATDAIHVSSSGTTLAQTGVANAFANASNLVSIVTGSALATTPASIPGLYGASNVGTVPTAEINTLGNILAACVNTGSAGSGSCTNLLGDAMNGAVTPTETATAAINIAHNPGANVAALFALVAATPPFASGLATAPNDWTVAINFTANVGGGQSSFEAVAIDASGNAWLANGNSLIKVSPLGVELNGPSGYYSGGISSAYSIAIDASGNAWVGNLSANTVTGFSPAGAALSGANGYAVGPAPRSLAFDKTGNLWVANSASTNTNLSSVSELNITTGNNINGSPFTGGGLDEPVCIALDVAGNAWVGNYASLQGFATEISSTGTVTGYTNPGPKYSIEPVGVAIDASGNKWFEDYYGSNAYGYYLTELTGSGSGFADNTYSTGLEPLFQYNGIAIDGSGRVFVTTYGSGTNNNYSNWIGEYSSGGTSLTPVGGFHDATSGCQDASGMAIDGSGNVWVSCGSPSGVMQYVGLATPVVTPLVANLKAPYNAPASRP